MKNNKKKLISFLTIFTLLFVSISFALSEVISYADDLNIIKTYTISSSDNSSGKSSNPKSSTKVPSSGSFNSNGNTNKHNYSTIKPDSGSFSTSPNSESNYNGGNSSTIKPDSGSFTTKPNNNSGQSNNSQKYDTYDDEIDDGSYRGGSSYGGGFFGGYFNPFRTIGYGGHISSWITNIVIIITVVVVAYIVIDMIRNRRD